MKGSDCAAELNVQALANVNAKFVKPLIGVCEKV